MNRDTELALLRRCIAGAASSGTAGECSTLAVESYTDESLYRREVEELFGQGPVCVGHAARVPRAGDYFTTAIDRWPILVVRGEDQRVRAFLNVCRHRGTRLVQSTSGCVKRLSCPYHAWSYRLDGALAGIPHRAGFPSGASELSLVELPLRDESGFLSIATAASRSAALALGPFARDLRSLVDGTGHCYSSRSGEYAANWKTLVEGALENYHVRYAHRDTIAHMFLDNVMVADHEGPHQRILFPKKSVRELEAHPESSWRLREHVNLVYFVFPNTLVLVQPEHFTVFHALPLAVDRVRMDSYTIVPEEPASDSAERHWAANDALMYAALDEDFAMGEAIWVGMRSGANRELLLGSTEQNLQAFHRHLRERLAVTAAPG